MLRHLGRKKSFAQVNGYKTEQIGCGDGGLAGTATTAWLACLGRTMTDLTYTDADDYISTFLWALLEQAGCR